YWRIEVARARLPDTYNREWTDRCTLNDMIFVGDKGKCSWEHRQMVATRFVKRQCE
ncbi:hypothetical protein PV327_002404, partial [Microctonus hyperodae]